MVPWIDTPAGPMSTKPPGTFQRELHAGFENQGHPSLDVDCLSCFFRPGLPHLLIHRLSNLERLAAADLDFLVTFNGQRLVAFDSLYMLTFDMGMLVAVDLFGCSL